MGVIGDLSLVFGPLVFQSDSSPTVFQSKVHGTELCFARAIIGEIIYILQAVRLF